MYYVHTESTAVPILMDIEMFSYIENIDLSSSLMVSTSRAMANFLALSERIMDCTKRFIFFLKLPGGIQRNEAEGRLFYEGASAKIRILIHWDPLLQEAGRILFRIKIRIRDI